jgi:hypothetical protein
MSAGDHDSLASFKIPKLPQISMVGSIDNIAHLRRELESLAEPADAKRALEDEKHRGALLLDLPYHGIFDRGRLIGLWEYDAAAGEIVSATFGKAPKELAAELERTEAFVRDQLGDARSFSLDSPESRGPKIAALKRLAAWRRQS